MDFQLRFLNSKPSKFLNQYADDKVKKRIEKLLDRPTSAIMTVKKEKQGYIAKCFIRGNHGMHIEVEEADPVMRAAIDRLADTLDNRITSAKGKRNTTRIAHSRIAEMVVDPAPTPEESVDAEEIIQWEMSHNVTKQ